MNGSEIAAAPCTRRVLIAPLEVMPLEICSRASPKLHFANSIKQKSAAASAAQFALNDDVLTAAIRFNKLTMYGFKINKKFPTPA